MAGGGDKPEADGERRGDHQSSAAQQLRGKGGQNLKNPPSTVQKQPSQARTCFQVEKLVAAKVERRKNYRTLVNFSTKEMEEVNSKPLPWNSTLWR